MASVPHFDLIVIGGGPAGASGAFTAAIYGRRVALVERTPYLGGAGINTGTVPSKTLRETALALSGIRARRLTGLDLSLRREATISDFVSHERQVTANERKRLTDRLEGENVRILQGTARFVDPHTIALDSGERLTGDYILVATGSSPARPPEFPFADPAVHDSNEILDLDRLPRTLAVVGAGVIGSEYASTFAALGTRVWIIDGRDTLLPFLDREVADALESAMRRAGIEFVWNQRVDACEACGGGPVTLRLTSGTPLEVEGVFVAAGRTSNTADLRLEAAGLTPGPRGLLQVDEHYRTTVPHILAAGDVIGFPALASTSLQQARIAVCRAFGLEAPVSRPALLPTGIYTIPEGEPDGGRRALCGRARRVHGHGAWRHHGRRGGIPEAAIPPIGSQARGRARDRRAGDRAGAHRAHGPDERRRREPARRLVLQFPDARRPLSSRRRAGARFD
jgi:NAD(P) transhydrogenase